MAVIAINATTDTGVSYRTVKSDSVSKLQVVEMLVDIRLDPAQANARHGVDLTKVTAPFCKGFEPVQIGVRDVPVRSAAA